jgi:hypothetical protein
VNNGFLSKYFQGAAAKTLSAVEADMSKSHQHEFNGVDALKDIFGEPQAKQHYKTTFIYLTDRDENIVTEEATLTWYDARQKAREEKGVMRWEYRMYFSSRVVAPLANEEDVLVIAKRSDNTLLAIIAEAESTIAKQVLWLFGFTDSLDPNFSVSATLNSEQHRIEFTSRRILESIGVDVEVEDNAFLEEMLEKFHGEFPTTLVFSNYARTTIPHVNARDNHDGAFMAWLEQEEILFRALEKHLIEKRLTEGFDGDVDGFIAYSLSVQNRRKNRAGLALENHLEALFAECDIVNTRTPKTENNSKPDFIFPSIEQYFNPKFNVNNLTMLGVKSSCKDRWRQVLTEANKINAKHLLTLEAAISKNQTEEMQTQSLQLVVPAKIHSSYSSEQQAWLMNVADFIQVVATKQKNALV